MTTFPSNAEYVEALQNPRTCFDDTELKGGEVARTPLEMPKTISGAFASVFSVRGSSGRRYAVKCFTRSVNGQHQRYQAIHTLLGDLAKPWRVEFNYIDRGVLVNGQWHAVLRMEWVEESQTLIPWLTQNLGYPDRILNVANQFATFIQDLQRAGIAHGDLQHGNLLVDAQQRLRVIDYDGMFVPAIRDLGSNEVGLANYQHPKRSGKDFGPDLDRFSAWLIYGSLLSLVAMPGLWWTMRKDGDEKLLLGREDFEAPLNAIEGLRHYGSPFSEFADVLTGSLSSSLAGVPEFDPQRIPIPTGGTATPQPHGSSSDWWRQGSPTPQSAETSETDPSNTAPMGSDWLRTHEPPPPPIDITGPSRVTKALALALSAVAMIGAAFTGAEISVLLGGLILLTWAAAMTTGVWSLWHKSDAVVGRAAASQQAQLAALEVEQRKAKVTAARSARAALDRDERKALQRLENQRSELPKSRAAEIESQSKDLRNQVGNLQNALRKLDADKAAEGAKQLNDLQEQHIQAHMMKRRIEPGVIDGIGPALVGTLAAHGFCTAADFAGFNGTEFRRTGSAYWSNVPGIGPAKSFSVQYWHQRQQSVARGSAPQALPAQQMRALESKFADLKRQKQAAIDSIPPQLQRIKATVEARYAALDREITQKADLVRRDYKTRRSVSDATVAQAVADLNNHENALLDAQRELTRYQNVSLSAYLKA
ncbi:MAG: hypothetical protein JW395_0566 [Nitrospira sp.]|nr:hypothetical protein [Nitrospira sp.]